MSRYLQASTLNPAGHRPWKTALYTGFEDYAFLKQPQNTIVREAPSLRPEIYRPPEMKQSPGLGAVTLVTGSGRVLRRRPRTLGAMMFVTGGGPQISSPILYRGPMTYIPPTILPPPSVPPVPTAVSSAPGGTIFALPGDATTPDSPFTPPSPAELGVPQPPPAPAAAPAASSLSAWFNSSTWISGVPNGYVALGIAGAIFLFGKKRR